MESQNRRTAVKGEERRDWVKEVKGLVTGHTRLQRPWTWAAVSELPVVRGAGGGIKGGKLEHLYQCKQFLKIYFGLI